jgi:hypothetical protein
MCSEKLAKAILYSNTPSSQQNNNFHHTALVAALRHLKTNPRLRNVMGFNSTRQFGKFIDSLLNTANWIEQLAPSASRLQIPNPEYPWVDARTRELSIPAEDFVVDPSVSVLQLAKLEALLPSLTRHGIF